MHSYIKVPGKAKFEVGYYKPVNNCWICLNVVYDEAEAQQWVLYLNGGNWVPSPKTLLNINKHKPNKHS